MSTATETSRPRARDIMSAPAVVIELDETMWDAWARMLKCGRRHLVVCEGPHCVAVLDDRTLFARWPTGPFGVRSTPIRDLLRSRTTCVLPDATVAHIAQVMVDERVDAVPVTDETGEVVGIVTGSDIAKAVARYDLGRQPTSVQAVESRAVALNEG